MIITVTIGKITANYVVRLTRAPRAYDGFGTLTLAEGFLEKARMVLIREEHLNWQIARYSSGMFASWEPEEFDRDAVEQVMWQRWLEGSDQMERQEG